MHQRTLTERTQEKHRERRLYIIGNGRTCVATESCNWMGEGEANRLRNEDRSKKSERNNDHRGEKRGEELMNEDDGLTISMASIELKGQH